MATNRTARPHGWQFAVVLVITCIVSITLGGVSAPQAADRRWAYDADANLIDDRITAGTSTACDLGFCDLIIDLCRRTNPQDASCLATYGTVDYVGDDYVILHHVAQAMLNDLLAGCPGIAMIEGDDRVAIALDVAARSVRARESTEYGPGAWDVDCPGGQKCDGTGQTIAILDTGIDNDHPGLDDFDDNPVTPDTKLGAGRDFTQGGLVIDPDDDNHPTYHGTWASGIVVGTGGASVNPGIYKGIAPKAAFLDLKVCGPDGTGRESDVIQALEWCRQNRDRGWPDLPADYAGIDIVYIGVRETDIAPAGVGRAFQSQWDQTVDGAVRDGMVVVVPAGNEGPGLSTICEPGMAAGALTVGAMRDFGTVMRDDDLVTPYSSRGPAAPWGEPARKPRVVGHGGTDYPFPDELIISARGARPGQPASGYAGMWEGTSAAAAEVAGVVALVRQAHPWSDPAAIDHYLTSTASGDIEGNPGWEPADGYGLVDAKAAVEAPTPGDVWICEYGQYDGPCLSPRGLGDNVDIWPDTGEDGPLPIGPNGLNMRVHNDGPTDAESVEVSCQLARFGTNTEESLDIIGLGSQVITVPANGADTVRFNWNVDGVHLCVAAVTIEYALDSDLSNNIGHQNFDVIPAGAAFAEAWISPTEDKAGAPISHAHDIPITVCNPSDSPETIEMCDDPVMWVWPTDGPYYLDWWERFFYPNECDTMFLHIYANEPVPGHRLDFAARIRGAITPAGLFTIGVGAAAGIGTLTPNETASLTMLRVEENPFLDEAVIHFRLPAPGKATVRVYDVTGRLVRQLLDKSLPEGDHRLEWDGKDGQEQSLPPGVYFCQVSSGGNSRMVKVTRVR